MTVSFAKLILSRLTIQPGQVSTLAAPLNAACSFHATGLERQTGIVSVRRNAWCPYRAAIAALGALQTSALAGPTGGRIVAGSGSIASSCGQTSIQQDTSRHVIDWRPFSTRPNESVTFSQQGASSIALNRVTNQDPSVLLGKLDANGQVFSVNPNGVLFGTGSRVNVGGLIASTLNASNSDFFNGRYVRERRPLGTGRQPRADPCRARRLCRIDRPARNQWGRGRGARRCGHAGRGKPRHRQARRSPDGLSIDQGVLHALASNHGLIQVDGGQARLAANAEDALLAGVVNNTGVIQARSAVNQNGAIRLVAIGALYVLNMSYGYFVEAREAKVRRTLRPVRAARTGRGDEPAAGELQHGRTPCGTDGPVLRRARLPNDCRNTRTRATRVTDERISRHDARRISQNRGTLDKYVGDAIMNFWGAPLEDSYMRGTRWRRRSACATRWSS
jgi:filamentous hemagglutinin family protein